MRAWRDSLLLSLPAFPLTLHCQMLCAVASGFAAQWLGTALALALREVTFLPVQRGAIMSLPAFLG